MPCLRRRRPADHAGGLRGHGHGDGRRADDAHGRPLVHRRRRRTRDDRRARGADVGVAPDRVPIRCALSRHARPTGPSTAAATAARPPRSSRARSPTPSLAAEPPAPVVRPGVRVCHRPAMGCTISRDGVHGGGADGRTMTGTGIVGGTVLRDGAPVLRDVTLQADDGELLVILGPSGSGKTTLLRAVAGLDKPSAGEVFVRGRRVTDLPTGERRLSMVFESGASSPSSTWRTTSAGGSSAGAARGRGAGAGGRRVRQLRLSRLLARRPGQLSGGERGLVGIGHALVQAPDAFLLDEPLATSTRSNGSGPPADRRGGPLAGRDHPLRHPRPGRGARGRRPGGAVAPGRGRPARPATGPLRAAGRPPGAGFVGGPADRAAPGRLVVPGGLAGFEVGPRTLPLWRPVPPPLEEYVGRDVVLGLRAEDVPTRPAAPIRTRWRSTAS